MQRYYETHGEFPKATPDLIEFINNDHHTRILSEATFAYYKQDQESFEICATFQTDNTEQTSSYDNWRHGTGRECFGFRIVDDQDYIDLKSIPVVID